MHTYIYIYTHLLMTYTTNTNTKTKHTFYVLGDTQQLDNSITTVSIMVCSERCCCSVRILCFLILLTLFIIPSKSNMDSY